MGGQGEEVTIQGHAPGKHFEHLKAVFIQVQKTLPTLQGSGIGSEKALCPNGKVKCISSVAGCHRLTPVSHTLLSAASQEDGQWKVESEGAGEVGCS